MQGEALKEEAILAALQRVTSSPEFSGAGRLTSFLEYVCHEAIQGRADAILGKTIFLDVYLRDSDVGSISESVVRVDASRLRQRLSAYYSGSGAEDDIHIIIDKGGYAPRFVAKPPRAPRIDPPAPEPFWPRFRSLVLVSAAVGMAFAVMLLVYQDEQRPRRDFEVTGEARTALLELSPRSLQARNLAQKARNLVLPATEVDRVTSALEMFERVIKLDPGYYGGYAGASQTTGILAGLAPTPEVAQEYMARSADLASRAVRINPESPWAQSSLAWTKFMTRDFDAATEISARAVELDPEDPHTLGFDAIISIFAGDFERVLESAAAEYHEHQGDYRFPWRTAQGIAYFHLNQPKKSATLLSKAAAAGEPVSEVNLAHLVAAENASGNAEKAAMLGQSFSKAWPESRVSALLERLFNHEQDARAVLDGLEAAGWTDPLTSQSPE